MTLQRLTTQGSTCFCNVGVNYQITTESWMNIKQCVLNLIFEVIRLNRKTTSDVSFSPV